MESPLKIYQRPRLRNPNLVVGWSDAGFVGISAVEYLIDKLAAKEFCEIEPYEFTSLPQTLVKGGVLQEIEYPASSFYYWRNRNAASDLILFCSKSPAMHHYEFANLIIDVAELFGVNRLYTVGGMYTNVSHTEKPSLFAVVNNTRMKRYLTRYDIEPGKDYHGTTSMNGLTLGIAKQRDLDGMSLWGRVPSYVGEMPNLPVSHALLRVLTRILNIELDFTDLDREARQAAKQIDELVSYLRQQDPELNEHIGKLEKGERGELSEEERHRFFKEIEEFLKKEKG